MKFGLFVLLLLGAVHANGSPSNSLARRILGERASAFHFEIDGERSTSFAIDASGGRVTISGGSPIALSSGFHWYLKHHCHAQISWNGDQLALPDPLPDARETRNSPYEHGFDFNYCTHSYSMPWWDWARWERELDYMAMCGIDLPLAATGSEAVWVNVLERLGYTHGQAMAFVPGPAYNAWWLMGNIEGRGGPVSDGWIASRVELQKKILDRMRELGMRPVLPGFVGLVPNNLPQVVPGTRILPQGRWAGPNLRPAVLHPDDPLFDRMAAIWYEEQEKLFGKVDAFAGDLFHEGGDPHGLDVGDMAAKVQQLMLSHDADSLWVIQGWGHNPTKELLSKLDAQHTMVLELCNEFWRNWEKSDGFWGTPWAFSTIIMYGGNTAMHGRLDMSADNLRAALASDHPPVALGTTWESIGINPVAMDFLWDMRWRNEVPEPAGWLEGYARRRYGSSEPDLHEAWKKLLVTGYGSHPGLRRPQESVFCALPSLNVRKASPFSATVECHYDPGVLRDAARLLAKHADDLGSKPTYQYDLVDCTRQFLTNNGLIAYRAMVAAFNSRDKDAFAKTSADFLALIADQDKLLSTRPEFMLGTWLHSARNVANSPEQAAQNEHAARMLITTWTEEQTLLDNYGWREWSGVLSGYYQPQWRRFIGHLANRLGGEDEPAPDFYPFRKAWAAKTLRTDPHPCQAQGDPVATSLSMLAKWSPWLDKNSAAKPAAAADAIGTWEYQADGATWRRTLHPDGKLSATRNGKPWIAWTGFLWKQVGKDIALFRGDGSRFGTIRVTGPGKARFSPDFDARRIETGGNDEADEIAAPGS